jgi:hypothetical protein
MLPPPLPISTMSITGVKIENLLRFLFFNIISGHYFGVPSSIKVHLAVVPPISSTIKFFFLLCFQGLQLACLLDQIL